MAAAGGAVDRLTREQVVATRAVGQLRVGLQGLAQQALGVTGPFGQLTSSVIGLFGGAAGLAAVAAAGGIALAIKKIGDAAEAEAARIKKLDDAIKSLLMEKGPNVALGTERQQRLEQLATAERALETARAADGKVDRFGEVTDNSKKIADLTSEIARLNVILGLVNDKMGTAVDDLLLQAGERSIGGIDTRLDLRGVPVGGPSGTFPGRGLEGRFDLTTPQQMLDTLAGTPAEQLQKKREEEEENIKRLTAASSRLNNEWEQMDRSMTTAAQRAQMLQIALINTAAGGLAMLASGGSAGGFLSFAGGAISLFNPIAGAIVAGVGSVVMAAESKRERHAEGETDRLIEAQNARPPVIIREHDSSDMGLEGQRARWNHYIGRGGRGPVPTLPRSPGLTRP